MHPFFRLVTLGMDPKEAEAGMIAFEKIFGPLGSVKAKLLLFCFVAPAFVAGAAVAYFGLYSYAMLILVAVITFMVGLLFCRLLKF